MKETIAKISKTKSCLKIKLKDVKKKKKRSCNLEEEN